MFRTDDSGTLGVVQDTSVVQLSDGLGVRELLNNDSCPGTDLTVVGLIVTVYKWVYKNLVSLVVCHSSRPNSHRLQ